eukprot:TRINITY_DN17089_c0_g1_i2.p1 TRINITY_DN17089_c0_g1~~TRINITY_DN17089_c0_g1_i2.p1  ORF type:complete len:623 (+),score=161.36 TRINITY_DN17089_c0_g1_i2:41-1870(+)
MADPALRRLQSHFGAQFDAEVLSSVLAVCGGNADQAIRFLTAGEGDIIDDPARANQEAIPPDYPARQPVAKKATPAPSPDIHEDPHLVARIAKLKKLFIGESFLLDHYELQTETYPEYVSCLLVLLHQGVDISKSSRSRILASAWSLKKFDLCEHLLDNFIELFGLPEVLRALQLMDVPRRKRALTVRLEKHLKLNPPKDPSLPPTKKVSQFRAQIANLTPVPRDFLPSCSVSGALAKKVRGWIKKIPAEQLHFYALQLPKEPWKELADMIHVSPSDFQCDWFLEVTFGKKVPSGSILEVCEGLNSENVVDILKQNHKIPYSFLRTHVRPLPDEAKDLIALYTPIDVLIWWHEELQTPKVDEIIRARLLDGEVPKFTYGKLMERLLYFKRNRISFYDLIIPIAENRLRSIELLLEPPVAVFGDGSYSMDVAIRTATIIASVLTILTGAELKFFNVVTVEPPCYPANVTDVIEVAEKVAADGLTAPAAALWPYYVAKKPVKFFVIVTDEVENGKFNGKWFFPDLYRHYYEEVYPAKPVFVSFLENPNVKGRMVTALENMGIEVLQFRLDGKRPDLTKMDTLLGKPHISLLISNLKRIIKLRVISMPLPNI